MPLIILTTTYRGYYDKFYVYYYFLSFFLLSTFIDITSTMPTLYLSLTHSHTTSHHTTPHHTTPQPTTTFLHLHLHSHFLTPYHTTLYLQLDQVLDLEIYPLPRVSPAYLVYPTFRPPKVQGPSRGDGVLRAQQMI